MNIIRRLSRSRVFSYFVAHDAGFAPNPFFGYCTLACSKPQIRRAAQPGDWIAGLMRNGGGTRVVHAMLVAEKLTFDDYWGDPRFADKQPDLAARHVERYAGDNIYEPLGRGRYRQLPSAHTLDHMHRDLGGKYVLVSDEFAYFGRNAIVLPPESDWLAAPSGIACHTEPRTIEAFASFISAAGFGVHGLPHRWPPKCGRRLSCQCSVETALVKACCSASAMQRA